MLPDFQQLLTETRLIGIFRGVGPDEAEDIIGAGIEGGLRIVEIPLNSPSPLRSIKKLVRQFTREVIVGAGTVTSVEEVQQVADAGGQLIVTPYARVDLVKKAKTLGLIVVPGALTPTEIISMHDHGADAVKLFPADIVSPATFKGLKSVLPKSLKLVPVGGITLENLSNYLAAGADGFGLGSALYRAGDKRDEVLQKTRAFVERIQNQKEK
jgi:2-dehydro-3-deoxyphosphogalactonate aldolase